MVVKILYINANRIYSITFPIMRTPTDLEGPWLKPGKLYPAMWKLLCSTVIKSRIFFAGSISSMINT